MIRFLFLIYFSFLSGFVQAQDVETIIEEVQLKSDSKQLAQKKALRKISREIVVEMIGESRYEEGKKKIEKYIIKNKNRYILSVRSSSPILQDSGRFSSTVTVKISRENLKSLLLDHNLFYSSEGSFCLLPLVSFSSHFSGEKKSYSWWLKTPDETEVSSLKELAGSFFNLLNEELIKQSFYVLNPVFRRMAEGTPLSVLPKKGRRIWNFVPLARFYSCDIILLGYVHSGAPLSNGAGALSNLFSLNKKNEVSDISQYLTQFSFNVFNIKTRQMLFQLRKQFPFSSISQKEPQTEVLSRSKDILDSLAYQLSSYQEEGSLDLNRLMISVQGPLTYAQKEQLKRALVKAIPDIQSLDERLLTSSRVVYLAESSQSVSSIARQLKAVSLPKFVIQVKGYRKQELEIYAKPRSR